jgi:hypothetical protein
VQCDSSRERQSYLLAAVALCVWHSSHDDALAARSRHDRVSEVRAGVEVVLRRGHPFTSHAHTHVSREQSRSATVWEGRDPNSGLTSITVSAVP